MGPAHVQAFEEKFGHALIGGYGMTETTGVVVMAPVGQAQRVDEATGALSVFRPLAGCSIGIVGDDDAMLPADEVGATYGYRGETVKAVVSRKLGADCSPDDLTSFCKERLAAYKHPRIVTIIDELLKTVTGKILRRALREAPLPEERRL